MTNRHVKELVYDHILQNYFSGEYDIGTRLPSERAFAQELNVSRNSVREALQLLKIQGYLETKPSGGSSILKTVNTCSIDGLTKEFLEENYYIYDMLEVRRALEVEAASLAAMRASAKDLQEMKSALTQMKHAQIDLQKGAEADTLFHLKIVEASRNELLIQLMYTLLEQMKKTIYLTRKHRFSKLDRHEETFLEHQHLYLAIASGDARLASERMEQHITKIKQEISEQEFHDTISSIN